MDSKVPAGGCPGDRTSPVSRGAVCRPNRSHWGSGGFEDMDETPGIRSPTLLNPRDVRAKEEELEQKGEELKSLQAQLQAGRVSGRKVSDRLPLMLLC